MHYTSCNYRQNYFSFFHSSFNVFSINHTFSKLTQTLSLTSKLYQSTLNASFFFIHFETANEIWNSCADDDFTKIDVDTNIRRNVGIKVLIPLEAAVDITASNAKAQMKRAKQFVESNKFVHLTLPDVESRINILVTEDETISLTAHDLG